MERPGCPPTAGSIRAVLTRVSFPAGTERPCRSSSLRAESRERSREWGGALPCRRLGPSSSNQVYSACYRHCHSVGGRLRRGEQASLWSVTAASLDAPGGADAHPPPGAPPGLPARSHRPLDSGGQFARKPTASLSCARGYVREDRPRGSGPRAARRPELPRPRPRGCLRVGGPRWLRGPAPTSPRTRTHPGPTGAREPAARPRIYIFPSLGAGVRLCILMRSCEPAGARRPVRRELHVSARLGAEPPRARSGLPPRTALLSSFIYFPK